MRLPELDPVAIASTRDALHAYARVLGAWLKALRPRRKHWWHASLRPSLTGLTTGVVDGPIAFEIELDLARSRLAGRTAAGAAFEEPLRGQSAAELATRVAAALAAAGIELEPPLADAGGFDYSRAAAQRIGAAFGALAGALAKLRASIREQTSPIQVWPHHFDLSMLWLPGEKIAGEDPADEERADKQMNFGFVLGDEGIAEPYLYVTAYPEPEGMPAVELPSGARWETNAFSGAVLPYRALAALGDPRGALLELWGTLLDAGRRLMLDTSRDGESR